MIPVESESTEARQQLLNRILASREFVHAHTLKCTLRYLYGRSADAPASPKEYDVAVQAMGRPANFDPRTDPVVRVSIGSIRDRLLAYFATEGKDERLRLTIPKGHYLPVFSTANAGATAAEETWSSHALMRFWRPYLTGTSANVIVYTEPLFFRDDEGHYFRDWNVNDLVNGPQQLRERLPFPVEQELKPSFHYLSAGEVHCMLSMSRMFHEMGVPVETPQRADQLVE